LRGVLQGGAGDLTAASACEAAAARLADSFSGVRDGLETFLNDGPIHHPQFAMLADDMRALVGDRSPERLAIRGVDGARSLHSDGARGVQPSDSREGQAAFRA